MTEGTGQKLERDPKTGRFLPGNSGGPGNPLAAETARLHAELVRAATPEDIREIALKLIETAKGGSIAAARELFDRVFGKPRRHTDVSLSLPSFDVLTPERLAALSDTELMALIAQTQAQAQTGEEERGETDGDDEAAVDE